MILFQQLACATIEEGEIDTDYARELMDLKRAEVEMHFSSLWRDLRPSARSGLIRGCDGPEPDNIERRALLEDGFIARGRSCYPSWLIERGKALGIVLQDGPTTNGDARRLAAAEKLDSLLYSINAKVRRSGGAIAFAATDESRRWFFLLRTKGTGEQILIDAVNHLSKVLYEGARLPNGRDWRLPPSLLQNFKNSTGYGVMVGLRNFFDHDPGWGADSTQPSKRFMNVGEIYQKYCGSIHPTRESDWLRVRDGLVDDLITALTEMDRLAESDSFPVT